MFDDFLVTDSEKLHTLDVFVKQRKLPIILYGSGVYAQEVESFLKEKSVIVDACFVDDIFLKNSHCTSAPVTTFNQIKAKYKHFVIVIAFCGDFSIPLRKLSDFKCKQIVDVLFFDCRFWELFGDFNTYVKDRLKDFRMVYDWLGDDLSRSVFVGYVNAKLTYQAEHLHHFFTPQHYFPDDLPAFTPNVNDIFIDGGAYSGDTLETFLARTEGSGCKKYIAFEPDHKNFHHLFSYVKNNNLSFVNVINKGLWRDKSILRFDGARETQSAISDNGTMEVKVDSIDHLGTEATFIKMDIEGAELEALKGASNTIKNYTPKLAISLYHKPDHLLDIPIFLKELCPDYKFFMRIHSYMSEELVLYAIVPVSEKKE